MSLFKNWSFSRKLLLVNAGYVLPCAVLVYFLILEKNNQLTFSGKERLGIVYQRPLQAILAGLGQYKIHLFSDASDDKDAIKNLDRWRSQINGYFETLDEVDNNLAGELAFTPAALSTQKKEKVAARSLHSDWLSLSESTSSSQSVVSERLDNLINNVRMAIDHVGDASNLILDPDLDTYYLMDATLLALPQTQDRLQQALVYIRNLDVSKPLSDEDKIKINIFGILLQADSDHILNSVQTSLSQDKNFLGVSASYQKEVPPSLKSFVQTIDNFSKAVIRFSIGKSTKEAVASLGDQTMDATMAFWSKAADELDKLLEIRIERIKRARLLALILALLAWLPVGIFAIFMVRRLNRSFVDAVSKLEFEATNANLSSIRLSAASQTVSSGSTEQAAAIQETGASMSQMASMVSRSSAQAFTSQELSHKVKEQTDEGCKVMERMVYSMEAIQEANAQLQNISNIINDISGKTNIINDIVGKTQLLSFNASIEAARAGQHGRGFAVVAEEVGNLARTSGNAAEEIRALIDKSKQQVEHILKTTLERVSEGRAVTESAQKIFAEITKDISLISTQISGISEAAREQQFGMEQIAKAMHQMDQTTQTNNHAAFEAAELSDHLMNQSRKLTMVGKTMSALVVGLKKENPSADDSANEDKNMPPSKDGSSNGSSISERVIANLSANEREMDHSIHLVSPSVGPDDESFKKGA